MLIKIAMSAANTTSPNTNPSPAAFQITTNQNQQKNSPHINPKSSQANSYANRPIVKPHFFAIFAPFAVYFLNAKGARDAINSSLCPPVYYLKKSCFLCVIFLFTQLKCLLDKDFTSKDPHHATFAKTAFMPSRQDLPYAFCLLPSAFYESLRILTPLREKKSSWPSCLRGFLI